MRTLFTNAAFEYQRDDPGRPPATRDPFVMLLGIAHLFRADRLAPISPNY